MTCAGGADETKTTIAYPTTSNPNNLAPLSVTVAAGNGAVSATTAFTYSARGLVATVDGPLPGADDVTTIYYRMSGIAQASVGPDPDGAGARKRAVTRTLFNANGLPSTVQTGTATGSSWSHVTSMTVLHKSETFYDTHFRPVKAVGFSGATATVLTLAQTSYDAAGRPECSALRMNPATFGAPPASACTPAATGTYGGDRISKSVYDAAGRMTQAISGLGTALEQTTQAVAYTANGRPLTLVDARGAKTTYEYDGHDRVYRMYYPHPTSFGTSSTTDYQQYNYGISAANMGLMTSRFYRGITDTYAYDDLGRVTGDNSSTALAPDYTLTYDNFGRLKTKTITGGATLAYAYDQLSRLVSEAQPQGTVSYSYDAAGRRTRLTWPGGSYYVDYDWNVSGELLKIRENGATSGPGVLATFSYDDIGRRTSIARGNGATTSYGYDAEVPARRREPGDRSHSAAQRVLIVRVQKPRALRRSGREKTPVDSLPVERVFDFDEVERARLPRREPSCRSVLIAPDEDQAIAAHHFPRMRAQA